MLQSQALIFRLRFQPHNLLEQVFLQTQREWLPSLYTHCRLPGPSIIPHRKTTPVSNFPRGSQRRKSKSVRQISLLYPVVASPCSQTEIQPSCHGPKSSLPIPSHTLFLFLTTPLHLPPGLWACALATSPTPSAIPPTPHASRSFSPSLP